MATGTFEMLNVFAKNKMFVAIAKYNNHLWPEYFKNNSEASEYGFYTIGMSDSELSVLKEFGLLYPNIKICVDITNGYTQRFASFIEKVRYAIGYLKLIRYDLLRSTYETFNLFDPVFISIIK